MDEAVFTTKFVMEDHKVITYVAHDQEDGSWQFFSDDKIEDIEKVAKVVGLQEIMNIDSTLLQLADMKEGYEATRRDKNDIWTISRIE